MRIVSNKRGEVEDGGDLSRTGPVAIPSPHEKEPSENIDFDFDFDQGLPDVYIL